jgi:hypothetical protein
MCTERQQADDHELLDHESSLSWKSGNEARTERGCCTPGCHGSRGRGDFRLPRNLSGL